MFPICFVRNRKHVLCESILNSQISQSGETLQGMHKVDFVTSKLISREEKGSSSDSPIKPSSSNRSDSDSEVKCQGQN